MIRRYLIDADNNRILNLSADNHLFALFLFPLRLCDTFVIKIIQ